MALCIGINIQESAERQARDENEQSPLTVVPNLEQSPSAAVPKHEQSCQISIRRRLSNWFRGVPVCHLHGHDQDVYRDYILGLFSARQTGDASADLAAFDQLFLHQTRQQLVENRVAPKTYAEWQRFAGIAVMCLDFNKNVRNAKHKRDKEKDNWNACQHFNYVREQWLNMEMGPYLHALQFLGELKRYRGTAQEEISGFVAYHSDRDSDFGGEFLVVIQGSMEKEDGHHNADFAPTNFEATVLAPLSVPSTKLPAKLKMHDGYAKIVAELYPQIMEAVSPITSKESGNGLPRIVVSGHSLGSSVAAGLLKVFDHANQFSYQGFLYAQPRAFRSSSLPYSPSAAMKDRVLDIHNRHDPVVLASQVSSYFSAMGTSVRFNDKCPVF